jgi:hypothetical protein
MNNMKAIKTFKGHIVSAHPYQNDASHHTDFRTTVTGKIIEKINVPYKTSKGTVPMTGYLMLASNNQVRTILSKDIIKYWSDVGFSDIKFSLLQIAECLESNRFQKEKGSTGQAKICLVKVMEALEILEKAEIKEGKLELA